MSMTSSLFVICTPFVGVMGGLIMAILLKKFDDPFIECKHIFYSNGDDDTVSQCIIAGIAISYYCALNIYTDLLENVGSELALKLLNLVSLYLEWSR